MSPLADVEQLRRALTLYASMFFAAALIIVGGILGMAATGTGHAHYWLDDADATPHVEVPLPLTLP